MHAPAFAAANPTFDPATYLAGMRSLGDDFWVIRDARSGSEKLQGLRSIDYPTGMAPSEYEARVRLLDQARAASPDWRRQLSEELKRTGYLFEVDRHPEARVG